jgi:hypothetical protein
MKIAMKTNKHLFPSDLEYNLLLGSNLFMERSSPPTQPSYFPNLGKDKVSDLESIVNVMGPRAQPLKAASAGLFDPLRTGVSMFQGVATTATRSVTLEGTRDVISTTAPFQIGQDTTSRTASSERGRPVGARSPICIQERKSKTNSVISEDPVDFLERKDRSDKIREKFSDVFDVRTNNLVCSDFEHSNLESFSDEIATVGCLCTEKSVKFFEALGASDYVLSILKFGHHSKLSGSVPDYDLKNNGSYYKHIDFAKPEILKLIKTGRVEVVSKKPKLVNPLHVVVQPNKNRLILDCSVLNDYIEVPSFKYEDHKVALNFFKLNGVLLSWDLKDGYNQISIHPDFRDYLGFKFEHEGKILFARYVCGCFGLKDLPYVFTKIFRVLIKHWRACGLPVCQFLDDGFSCLDSQDQALEASLHIQRDLLRAGAVWSTKKCIWNPVRELDWIGITWCCDDGSIRVKERRVVKLLKFCDHLLSCKLVSARNLAAFTGQVISLMPVVGDVSRLYSRCSQIAVANATSWDTVFGPEAEVISEIVFWKENLVKLNKRLIFDVSIPKRIISLKGDASASGCGSFIEGTDIVAARLFSPEECEQHSTWRELANVHFSLEALLPFIKGSYVKFLVDSQSAQHILKCGSMKPDCHFFAKNTFDFCLTNDISLDVGWIPRNLNKEADLVSREPEVLDSDDWGISNQFFSILERRWGEFSIDCFANFYNSKVSKFYSFYQVPGTSGVDAFSFDWGKEFCLLVPPVSIVGRVLRHLLLCKGKGVLIVPCWPSAYFWPLLINDFNLFISDILKVKGKNVLVHGLNKNSLLGSSEFKGFVLALKLDCSISV